MEYLAYFFGGALLANGLPHFVQGMSGRGFPTPFARLRGLRESSAMLNVFWGAANFVAGYLLLFHAVHLDFLSLPQMAAVAVGAIVLALGLAWEFGSIYGGNKPGVRGHN